MTGLTPVDRAPATRDTEMDKPYTDADVQMLLRVLPIDHEDGTTLVEVVPGDPPRHIWGRPERVARAVLDALAVADRLTPAGPVDDIEATGQCCCAGCVGMGPCDRDDRGQP